MSVCKVILLNFSTPAQFLEVFIINTESLERVSETAWLHYEVAPAPFKFVQPPPDAPIISDGAQKQRYEKKLRMVHVTDLRHIDGYKVHLLSQLRGLPADQFEQKVLDLSCDNDDAARPTLPLVKATGTEVIELCLQLLFTLQNLGMKHWIR